MPQNIENMNFTQDVDVKKSASFYFEYWSVNEMNEMVKEDYKTSQFPSDYQLYSFI